MKVLGVEKGAQLFDRAVSAEFRLDQSAGAAAVAFGGNPLAS